MDSNPVVITREVSRTLAECELTYMRRSTIDLEAAASQHRGYEECLRQLGARVHRLPALHEHPDAVFVEDCACVFDGFGLVTRPGAPSRREEVAAVARDLASRMPLETVEGPGTLDGGDVLQVGKRVFIGQSKRTNPEGFRQAKDLLARRGYEVSDVQVGGCLHLKTGSSLVADGALLVNPHWIDTRPFSQIECIPVPEDEPWAANVLSIQGAVVMPQRFPKTTALLEDRGLRVLRLDLSEFAKAEGGITCLGIVLPVHTSSSSDAS